MTRSYGPFSSITSQTPAINGGIPTGFTLGLNPTEGEMFKDSQFLVLANRLLAFILSGFIILVRSSTQPKHIAPLYKYSFASLSNIMSSWFQYEALKYISFPTQVLGEPVQSYLCFIFYKFLFLFRESFQNYTGDVDGTFGLAQILPMPSVFHSSNDIGWSDDFFDG